MAVAEAKKLARSFASLNENLETFARPCLLLSAFPVRLDYHSDRLAAGLVANRSDRRHGQAKLIPELLISGFASVATGPLPG